MDVFHDYDRVIDHETNGQNHGQQRQQVDGETHDEHEKRRADEREGDGAAESRPPVVVQRGGHELTLSGRIDRLDVSKDGRKVLVVDYKGANVEPYRGRGWVERRELQAGLYALVALGLEPDVPDWDDPLTPLPPTPFVDRARSNAHWLRVHAAPWATRRIRHRSSGDGRSAKRPVPLPVEPV